MSQRSVFDLLRRAGIDPKKSLGQNFLVDERYLDRIVDAAELSSEDIVLEVGPGLGTLTARLAANAGHVIAVELDDRLVPLLRAEFALQENVHIVHGDILKLDVGKLITKTVTGDPQSPTVGGYKLVANLPYYITSAVLRHVLEATPAPSRAAVMVQAEVADRICAQPGDMSILSVAVQFYAKPSIAFQVPAGAFYPVPKVDSAVLQLDVRPHTALAGAEVDTERFFALVRAGFSQKRKQLRNSLSAGLHRKKDEIDAALVCADIDPSRRAQTLSIAEWLTLYQALNTR
jgi:16S rRNA (adenine1518-N6/adenine1519-N6)-dimethyltransferase